MTDEAQETPPAQDWRERWKWKLVDYDASYFPETPPTDVPPPEAELAQPDGWASLYSKGPGARIVATWTRITV